MRQLWTMSKIMSAATLLAAMAGGFALGTGSAEARRPLPPSHHASAGFGMKTSADGGTRYAKPPKKPICTTWTDCFPVGNKSRRPQ
jgi:hypothetical protein